MAKKHLSASEIDGVQYRRAKLWQIICYACNGFVGMSVYSLIGMASYSASIGYGITTAAVGIILTCSRILDAITDPLLAFVYDRVNTRFGKLRILLVVGYLIEAAALYGMFTGFSSKGLGLPVFVLLYVGYVIGYTVTNMTAVCIRDGMSKSKKTGEVSIMNRARYSLSNGTVIVNNNENRYFLIGQDGDTTYFETWGDNIDAKEYEDWWIPRLQTDEIFTTDSSRMLVYTDRPYVWLHRTDGTLIKKVFVEKRPDEVREDFGGLGFDCGRLFGDHFLLMISDLVSENPIKVSNRLMLFDYDMNPEAVYSIPGENLDFYSDPKTGLVWIPDPSEEVIRVYDLSEWI